MAFSFETEDVPLADRMSMAVDYAPQSEIARGGMGKIFSAEDSTLGREVALKVSMGKDARQEAQFFREARVLAQLAHPNIVPIHSFGTDSLGRPFYSMKLVRGRTLQAILKQLQTGDAETASVFTRQRLLDVFRKVCDGVSSAHAKGYLHRDLKPENIMVGEYGEVLVMDWGLVKGLPNRPGQLFLDPEREDEPAVLNYVEGTPQYMSPEQAAGMYGGLDERSDIYALGGILFAILTLRPPVTGSSVKDVLRKVREGEIGTKSFPAGSLGEQTPSAAVKTVPGALMAVALKALSRDRDRRYPSVEALVADIEAYQAGFATVAEEATLLRLMTLFVRRHRAASVLAAVLLVAAGLFAVRLAASERRADRESKAARASEQTARESASRAEEQARLAEENAARAVAEREAARKANADASIANAEAAEKTLNADYIRNALEAVPEDLRTQEWEYLNRFLDSSERTIVANRGSYWKDCVPHPQRPGVLVTLEPDNWVRFLDLKDGSVEDVLELKGVFVIGVLAVSEDSKKLAVISTEIEENKVYKHSIKVFGLTDGKTLLSIPILDPLRAVLKFSADGRFLMKTYRRAWAQGLEPALYDVETGAACWPVAYAGMYDADFVPSDSGVSKPLVNWASKNHGLVQIDPILDRLQKPSIKFPVPQSTELFVSRNAVFTHTEGVLRRINPDDGNSLYEFRLPAKLKSVRDVVYLRKHNVLLSLVQTGERSAVLDVRDAWSGAALVSFPMVMDGINGVREWRLTAHPDSGHVAVFRGKMMKVWNVARAVAAVVDKIEALSGPGFTFVGDANKVLQVSIERKMLEGERTQPVEIRQLSQAGLSLERQLGAERVESNTPVVLSPSRDGKTVGALIQAGTKPSLKIFHFEGGSPRVTGPIVDFSPRYGSFAMSPDGDLIWGGSGIFDATTGERRHELWGARVEKGADPYSSSQGSWTDNAHFVELCTVQSDEGELERALVVWSTSQSRFVHSAPAPHARAIAVSPDGAVLAEGGYDRRLRIRDAATLEVSRVLRVHDAPVVDVAWNPKLPYLATAGEDFRVRIWDLASGGKLEEIGFLEAMPAQLHWSPDGRTLAVRGQPFKDEKEREQAKRYFFYPKCCSAK